MLPSLAIGSTGSGGTHGVEGGAFGADAEGTGVEGGAFGAGCGFVDTAVAVADGCGLGRVVDGAVALCTGVLDRYEAALCLVQTFPGHGSLGGGPGG